VGREDDLAWLLGLWRAVAEHGGRVGTLRGEAGIGKSRLAEALRERLGDGCVPMRFQCSPRYDNRALHPVTQHIEQAVMIAPQDPADAKLAKLVTWLRPDDAAYRLALLATLMSVPPEVAPPLPLMTAERRKRDTFELLLTGLRERAAARPLLILFEDLHWADPTTVEFLSTLVERIDGMAALAIFTFRPDFSAPWTGPHVESRALHRLPRPPALRLVEHVAGAERIPDAVLEEVVVRADGIPLFIEELTKAVVSLGAVDERAGGQAFAIPFTLQDSLMARLDQLGSAKLVAQMASAIGREFSFSVLRAIASLPAERLRADLMTLEDAGLVHARGGVFAFKHALVQEVAYQTLLRARRQRLHSLIALVLLEQLPQQARDAPELLAHHWTEAGDAERAVAGWLAAGERACGRSEYSEAVGHLRKGLALVERLPDTAGRHAQELALLLALGPVLMMRTGAATPEVAGLYARALELCAEFPKSERHFAAQWGCWRAALDHHAGLERADKLLALAREIGDPALLVQAHHCQWPTLHVLGAHEECRRHAEEGVRLYDPERHQLHAHLYGGHDPKVCALGVGSVSCWLLGRFDESLASARLALEWAEALGHVGSRVRAMDYALEIRRLRRDVAEVARRADGMWAFATEQHLGEHAARAAFVRGWATALLGDVHRGLADMHRALESEGAAGSPSDFPLYYEMLAEVYERAGWFDRGLDAVSAGLAYAERGQLAFWNAELHRRRAELVLAAGGDPVAAAECYESALSVARDQGARFLELRAATGLARLRLRDGLSSDPMAGLRAVYAGFPRGHDVPDLRAARALLATSPSP